MIGPPYGLSRLRWDFHFTDFRHIGLMALCSTFRLLFHRQSPSRQLQTSHLGTGVQGAWRHKNTRILSCSFCLVVFCHFFGTLHTMYTYMLPCLSQRVKEAARNELAQGTVFLFRTRWTTNRLGATDGFFSNAMVEQTHVGKQPKTSKRLFSHFDVHLISIEMWRPMHKQREEKLSFQSHAN